MSSPVSPTRDAAAGARVQAQPGVKPSSAYWLLTLLVVVVDVLSKAWAVENLVPRHVPHPVIGDYLRFTLAYNPGAAFGMHLGPASRWIFATLSVAIVAVLLRSTRELVTQSRVAAFGVPIVIGGAIGNLIDRIRFREGVVDFIDVGVGTVRFWTFNVADSAVTVGACCLVIALWRHDESKQS
ncbi:MAG: signal peptidase II [Phycisphaerae bacterium]|nr:signal peptidase II [Gemmatimonadaceae bacterium]